MNLMMVELLDKTIVWKEYVKKQVLFRWYLGNRWVGQMPLKERCISNVMKVSSRAL